MDIPPMRQWLELVSRAIINRLLPTLNRPRIQHNLRSGRAEISKRMCHNPTLPNHMLLRLTLLNHVPNTKRQPRMPALRSRPRMKQRLSRNTIS
jgi:hypothetical protein